MEKLVKKQNKPENRLIKNRIFKNILKFSQVKAQHDHGGENFKKDFIISEEFKKIDKCFNVNSPHFDVIRTGLFCCWAHGIKKTRYDITHFTESQHGKYEDLKNGWFCKNSSRSQYNFRFGLKNKTHGPMDCLIKNFPKKKLIFKNYFPKKLRKLGYFCNRSYRACILPWILNVKRNKFHVLKPYNL